MTGGRVGGVPDLRLAGFAVATWLAALAALHLRARYGIALGASALGGAVAVTVARWPRRFRMVPAAVRWIGLTVLLGIGCGAGVTGSRVVVRESGPLVALVRAAEPVRVEAVVRDDPRALRGSPGRSPTFLVAVELWTVRAEGAAPLRLSARALVLAGDPGWRGLLPGQRVAVLLSSRAPTLLGRPPWVQRAAGVLRAGLQRACEPLPDDAGGLLPGLVVGDTSRLDPALGEDFRTTGLTHLMAVSGANVVIILGVVLFAVRWTRAGPVPRAVVCAAALIGFVILARPSPSVVRAAAMGAIGLLGLASGRPRAALPALAAGVAVLILIDPELAADPGFALSVLATSGLLLLAPAWRDALRRRGCPPGVAEALAVPAAAQVACGPVVAGLSGSVSLVAVPANLLVVPVIAPATLLGVVAAVLSPVWRSRVRCLARALAGEVAGAGGHPRRPGAGRGAAVAGRCARRAAAGSDHGHAAGRHAPAGRPAARDGGGPGQYVGCAAGSIDRRRMATGELDRCGVCGRAG